MKKFIAMFAFAATIVLGAVALASCEEEIENPANVRHRFTVQATLYTSIVEYKDSVADLEKQLNTSLSNFSKAELGSPMTEGEASLVWMNISNKFGAQYQEVANSGWTELGDKDFKITVTMMEDGDKIFHKQEYTPNKYLDF